MKKSRSLLILVILIIASLLLTSCASGNKADSNFSPVLNAPEIENSDKGDGIITGGTESVIPDGHLVIKTARETVETEEYDDLIDFIRNRTAELGGYISASEYYDNSYNSRYNRSASITVRIPADKFDEFNTSVGEMGTVTYFTESVQDVTLEYVDVDSRIKVLEAEETALNQILAKAESLNDILLVRESLKEVQAQLASLRAQKNSLDNRIAYSTVYMTVREVETVTPADEGEVGFFAELGRRFTDSIDAVGGFFRGLALFLLGDAPVIILVLAIGTGIFFFIRFLVKRKRAKRAKNETKPE